ncbi:MAG: AAA family ATPase, partial [Cyanobacteria bacterium J06635_10]
VAELSGSAAQNRFNLLFQKFIQVFTTKEHPLVIFLDDLQWGDSVSLKLMQLLISESETNYLLLIGAYRDNEVFPAHPLMLILEEIRKAKAIVNAINLLPLNEDSLNKLVADALTCELEIAKPLTQLVYQKTKGNPFFSTQFLKALYEDSLIKFDFDTGSWFCDLTKIKTLSLTDNVVEFMALQLQKLPEKTQNILKIAACIGNKFDLATLAVVCEKSESQTAEDLWKAVQLGLILPQSEVYKFYLQSETDNQQLEDSQSVNYKFLHDRVQQAAYSLIPEQQKQKTHYHIGQLLLQKTSPEVREERIFEIVNQLNYGITFISQESERTELAKINLIACRKAKTSTAYQAGREYANTGLSLLRENHWKHQYKISLEFHNLAAELASLCGDLSAMEQLIEKVVDNTKSPLEQVDVYRIRIQSKISQTKLNSAISIAQKFLLKFGVTFPKISTQKDLQQEFTEIRKLIGNREVEELLDLPIMKDDEKIAVIQIANSIMSATYISGSLLHPFLVALSVKLSIQYGNTEASGFAYASYGLIVCDLLKDIDTGVRFGRLALQVVSKLDAKAAKPEVLVVLGLFLLHRKFHIKETLVLLKESYAIALEVGNIEFVGHAAHQYCLNSFWCAQPLSKLEQETRRYSNGLIQINQIFAVNYSRIYLQSILNLLSSTEHQKILSGEAFQEIEILPQLIEANDLFGLYLFYLHKLILCYLFDEIESAQKYAIEARKYLIGGTGTVGIPAFYFYDSLIALAALNSQSQSASKIFERLEENQDKLQKNWSNYAPMNHQHKFDLVQAEKYRFIGQKVEAINFYDKAIAGAKDNEFIQEEALANELAAKFYLDWGKDKIAATYRHVAYY